MIKNTTVGLFFFLIQFYTFGQHQSTDIQHLVVDLRVNDSTNVITVKESIQFSWVDTTKTLYFDLTAPTSEGKGMKVTSVLNGATPVNFKQEKEKVFFPAFSANGKSDFTFTIQYQGIPIDGLIIGKNKFGNRTFFADNWPDRAHNWLICNDHPSDKTTIDFNIQAPKHYEIIANGAFVSKNNSSSTEVEYRYHSGVPLPVKVLVIGIADFSIKEISSYKNFPLSSWIYPENEADGFYDFDLAPEILDFYIGYLGKYEYEKLANVQSTTRFGGMENAGCIFYDENAITGKRTSEALLAHEIAHQWFGNSASEKNWEDLWLSEGIVTYFTNLYIQQKHGQQAFVNQLEIDRLKIIKFSKVYKHPVVDTSYTTLMSLLNANSYQKGGWALHMLSKKLGSDVFKKGILTYYQRYRLSNASTSDFKHVMEEVSGIDLTVFFNQWFHSAGIPVLDIKIASTGKKAQVALTQQQAQVVFAFPITIEFTLKGGKKIYKEIEISSKTTTLDFSLPSKLLTWKVDPFCNLLFENATGKTN